MMARLGSVLGTFALLALVGGGVLAAAGPQASQPAPTSYEFNQEDMRIIVARMTESLLVFERAGFDAAKVAWLRLRNDTEERRLPLNLLMEAIEVGLIKSGRCQVLKRTDLEAIAAEHALSMTALADPAAVTSLRGFAGVDYWLSATLTARTNREDGKEFVYYNFTGFLTDARTSERVWGDSAEIKKARKLQLVEKRMK